MTYLVILVISVFYFWNVIGGTHYVGRGNSYLRLERNYWLHPFNVDHVNPRSMKHTVQKSPKKRELTDYVGPEQLSPEKEVVVSLDMNFIKVRKSSTGSNFFITMKTIQYIPDKMKKYDIYIDMRGESLPKWFADHLQVGSAMAEQLYEILDHMVWALEEGYDVPIMASWSKWDPWGPCDVKAGNGHRLRFRQCIAVDNSWCKGNEIQKKSCFVEANQRKLKAKSDAYMARFDEIHNSPILPAKKHRGQGFVLGELAVNMWNTWSPCSASCGSGAIKTRIQDCHSGQDCTQTQKCQLPPCEGLTGITSGPVTVEEGAAVSLHCGIESIASEQSVVWYNPDDQIVWGRRYAMVGNVLRIQHVQTNDAGTYTCSVGQEEGIMQRDSVHLVVRSCLIGNPCLHGGVCVERSSKKKHNTSHHVCQCQHGYSGHYCEIQDTPETSLASWKIALICITVPISLGVMFAVLYGFVDAFLQKKKYSEQIASDTKKPPGENSKADTPKDLIDLSVAPGRTSPEHMDSCGYLVPEHRSSLFVALNGPKYQKSQGHEVKLPRIGEERSDIVPRKVQKRENSLLVLLKQFIAGVEFIWKKVASVKKKLKSNVVHPNITTSSHQQIPASEGGSFMTELTVNPKMDNPKVSHSNEQDTITIMQVEKDDNWKVFAESRKDHNTPLQSQTLPNTAMPHINHLIPKILPDSIKSNTTKEPNENSTRRKLTNRVTDYSNAVDSWQTAVEQGKRKCRDSLKTHIQKNQAEAEKTVTQKKFLSGYDATDNLMLHLCNEFSENLGGIEETEEDLSALSEVDTAPQSQDGQRETQSVGTDCETALEMNALASLIEKPHFPGASETYNSLPIVPDNYMKPARNEGPDSPDSIVSDSDWHSTEDVTVSVSSAVPQAFSQSEEGGANISYDQDSATDGNLSQSDKNTLWKVIQDFTSRNFWKKQTDESDINENNNQFTVQELSSSELEKELKRVGLGNLIKSQQETIDLWRKIKRTKAGNVCAEDNAEKPNDMFKKNDATCQSYIGTEYGAIPSDQILSKNVNVDAAVKKVKNTPSESRDVTDSIGKIKPQHNTTFERYVFEKMDSACPNAASNKGEVTCFSEQYHKDDRSTHACGSGIKEYSSTDPHVTFRGKNVLSPEGNAICQEVAVTDHHLCVQNGESQESGGCADSENIQPSDLNDGEMALQDLNLLFNELEIDIKSAMSDGQKYSN